MMHGVNQKQQVETPQLDFNERFQKWNFRDALHGCTHTSM